jgi:glutamate synthase (NADPH/NADH) small chain
MAVQIKKLGAETVTMVYRRGFEDMGATDHEQQVAQTSGVLIRTHAQPHRILAAGGQLTGVEFEYTEKDGNGRLKGTGETFVLAADQLFKAIGQALDATPLEGDEKPELIGGRIKVDEFQRTSLADVWAGGDCTPGKDLTVTAVQDGKIAAISINEYLNHG